jgi:glutamate/aspartate transport system substrate-binding protein
VNYASIQPGFEVAAGFAPTQTQVADAEFTASHPTTCNFSDVGTGKTVVSTAGTTNIKQVVEANAARNLGITVIPAKDHAEAFLLVELDRAAAFVMDDILLASLVASSRDPSLYQLSDEAFSLPEPYGIMLRKDDAPFKALADKATAAFYRSAEGMQTYAKWFQSPIPPKGLNLNVPMNEKMKKVFSNPTDSPDPAAY